VLAGGRLILLNTEGQIVSVSPTTGEKGEIVKGGAPFSLPPLVANNMLYTIDTKGRISAWR